MEQLAKSTNGVEVIDNIPVVLDVPAVRKRLRMRTQSSRFEDTVRQMTEIAISTARPKAIYKVSCVGAKNSDSVEIDGVSFSSKVLRINLQKAQRVIPYVVTCGREVDSIQMPVREVMKAYCLDVIKMMIVTSAAVYLRDYLASRYQLGELSSMHPGEIESWPLAQQKPLFSLLGDVEHLIGVRLTEGHVMIPIKSRSGIFFPAEIKFESCTLCHSERCTGRRAPYDPELERKYQETAV
ncbi:MAG: vitamin B12 dependent methionine synthase [Chloroflexi bacterium]|nr:vitamin B12 dependent methionine synthase [Chloroflexota bacterium]